MPSNPLSGPLTLEITAIAHATEDPSKVEAAMLLVLPDYLHGKTKFTRRYLEGHHGNEIVTISTKSSNSRHIEDAAVRIGQLLPTTDKRLLAQMLPSYIDGEGNLYLRFDKQRAVLGQLSSEQVDPIRVRIKFASTRNFRDAISSFLQRSGLIE